MPPPARSLSAPDEGSPARKHPAPPARHVPAPVSECPFARPCGEYGGGGYQTDCGHKPILSKFTTHGPIKADISYEFFMKILNFSAIFSTNHLLFPLTQKELLILGVIRPTLVLAGKRRTAPSGLTSAASIAVWHRGPGTCHFFYAQLSKNCLCSSHSGDFALRVGT